MKDQAFKPFLRVCGIPSFQVSPLEESGAEGSHGLWKLRWRFDVNCGLLEARFALLCEIKDYIIILSAMGFLEY